jgi:8-oxo-dGTP pyrophosphatase MutT (NUDIX family)
MSAGRFYAYIAALLWFPPNNTYLLLKRSEDKDFASGVWECVTGRVGQGESFEDALRREVHEELGIEVQIEFIIGTTHFYRGDERPENELIGVAYCCFIDNPEAINISAEHSEYRWVTPEEAYDLLSASDPGTRWAKRVIKRAEALRTLLPSALRSFHHEHGCELDR